MASKELVYTSSKHQRSTTGGQDRQGGLTASDAEEKTNVNECVRSSIDLKHEFRHRQLGVTMRHTEINDAKAQRLGDTVKTTRFQISIKLKPC